MQILRTLVGSLLLLGCLFSTVCAQRIPTSYGNNEETDWLKKTTRNFVIVYPGERPSLADSVVYLAEQTYDIYQKQSGLSFDELIELFVNQRGIVHSHHSLLNNDEHDDIWEYRENDLRKNNEPRTLQGYVCQSVFEAFREKMEEESPQADSLYYCKRNVQDTLTIANPVGKLEPYDVSSPQEYHYAANIRLNRPFLFPFYLNPDEYGFVGLLRFKEPMKRHEISVGGIYSMKSVRDKTSGYFSYINRVFRPQIELTYSHYTSATTLYGQNLEVRSSDVVSLSSIWLLTPYSESTSRWYAGAMVRYMEFNYHDDDKRARKYPDLIYDNDYSHQTDIRLGLAWKGSEPRSTDFIHPLNYRGVRLLATGTNHFFGSEASYLRTNLEAFTTLPSYKKNRWFLLANGLIQWGTPVGRDYIAFDERPYGNPGRPELMGSPSPGEGFFVRGYNDIDLGNQLAGTTVEYRIPFQFQTHKKAFGIIPPARSVFILFWDQGLLTDARTSVDKRVTSYRSGIGFELRRVLEWWDDNKIVYTIGLGQPLTEWRIPYPHFSIGTGLPF